MNSFIAILLLALVAVVSCSGYYGGHSSYGYGGPKVWIGPTYRGKGYTFVSHSSSGPGYGGYTVVSHSSSGPSGKGYGLFGYGGGGYAYSKGGYY